MIAAFLTTILWALSGIFGARSAKLIGGTEANFWRLSLATGFLAIWSYVWGAGLTGHAFGVFFISGLVGIGVGDLGYFQALPRIGPRLSLLMVHCLTAPFAAAIEWEWLGAKLTTAQIVFGVITLAGVGISLAPDKAMKISRRDMINGVLFTVAGAFCGAIGAVMSRKGFSLNDAKGTPIDPGTAAFQRAVGGVFIAGICLLVVKWRSVHGHLTRSNEAPVLPSKEKWRRAGPWILANSLAGQTVGVSCYLWALHTTQTGVVLPIVATTPLIAVPLTMMIDGERPSVHSIVGSVIAVAGVVGLAMSQPS